MDQINALIGQEARPESSPIVEEPHQESNPERHGSMEALLAQEGLGLDFPQEGEIRQGVIASIGENEILVSIGTKSEGVIPLRELDQVDPETRESFSVG